MQIPKKLGYKLELIDHSLKSRLQQDNRLKLVQIFIRGNPFRGKAGLSAIAQKFYHELFATGSVQGLIIYGSPYIWEWFQDLVTPGLPRVFSYGQMSKAQQLACERMFGILAPPRETDQVFI